MRIAIMVANSLKKDPRVIKQVKTALAAGHEVLFVGHRDAHYDPAFLDGLGIQHRIVDLGARYVGKLHGFHKKVYREWALAARPVGYLRAFHPDVIHANDLETLPSCYVAARLCGARLIYDAHEIWAENISGRRKRWVGPIATRVERFLTRRVDQMITVSHSAAAYYEALYHIPRPMVVTNCPMRSQLPPLPKAEGRFEALYHGLMISGRGYAAFVRSAALLPRDAVVILRGYGSIEPALRDIAASLSSGTVTFEPPVEVAELVAYAARSHVGVVLTEPVNINFIHTVSNKLFEYAHAGLPVIMSDVPEHRYLNEKYRFGLILEQVRPGDIAAAIRRLKDDPVLYQTLKRGAEAMAREMCWEREAERLAALYAQGKKRGGRAAVPGEA